jgi:hypothetical protein
VKRENGEISLPEGRNFRRVRSWGLFRKRDGLASPNVTAHPEERIKNPGVISILLIHSCIRSRRRELGIYSE